MTYRGGIFGFRRFLFDNLTFIMYNYNMQTHYIIDVVPPTGGVEYLIVSEAPSVPQDASESKVVPKDAEWQRRTGSKYLLLNKGTWGENDGYLLEVASDDGCMVSGLYWMRDRYGWQQVGQAVFNLGSWLFEEVDAVFDPNLNPDSVRVLR